MWVPSAEVEDARRAGEEEEEKEEQPLYFDGAFIEQPEVYKEDGR